MNLSKELQKNLGEHDPNDVDELILDDIFENIESFTEQNKKDLELYKNLVHLSLNGFGLKSLKNFPALPELNVLELRGNHFNGKGLEVLHSLYPKMYKLKIGENPIQAVSELKSLSNSKITKIELQGTKASEEKTYKQELFKLIPTLDIVDNHTKDGEEIETTDYDQDGEGEEEDDDFDAGEDEDDGEFDEYDDEDEDEEE